MYSEDDINAAVAAGALSSEAAAGLRAHVSALRAMPRGDEESFRLVTSFNELADAVEGQLAERVGFEPTVRFPAHRISSAAHSTTLPPLREGLMRGAARRPGAGRRCG